MFGQTWGGRRISHHFVGAGELFRQHPDEIVHSTAPHRRKWNLMSEDEIDAQRRFFHSLGKNLQQQFYRMVDFESLSETIAGALTHRGALFRGSGEPAPNE